MTTPSPRPLFDALAQQGDVYLALLWKNLLLSEPLMTRLRHDAAMSTFVADVVALPVSAVVAQATPFLWESVSRLLSIDTTTPQPTAERALLLHAIDSFGSTVRAPFSLRMPAATTLVLPKRGLAAALRAPAELRGTPAGGLQLLENGVERPFESAAVTLAGGWGNVVATPDLFYANIAPNVATGALRACARQVSAGLALINRFDPVLAGQIRATIRHYVPVYPQHANQHHSFTTSAYPGVIFLSESDNALLLAETIIHEFAHTELDRITAFEPIHHGPPDAVYYSPWRPDARPLTGLFHAIYVFANVYAWFGRVDAEALRPTERAYWLSRRELIYWRLRIGMEQVPTDVLNPLCRDVFGAVQAQLDALNDGRSLADSPAATTLLAHLSTWQALHPHYVVNRPELLDNAPFIG